MMTSVRLLVLGGSWFLGRDIAQSALQRGWSVTTFNRGRSAPDLDGVELIRGDRTVGGDLARLTEHGPWDAVVDTSGFVPRVVRASARLAATAAQHYLFVSTVNVYQGWPVRPLSDSSAVLECPPDADASYGADLGEATQYGALKAGCERAVIASMGAGRATVLRPGVILGPREYVGRLPWWLRRVAQGGTVLAPGSPARRIQPIDVRDVAAFALRAIGERLSGSFNLTSPPDATFGQLLESCKAATGSDATFAWVPDGWLVEQGVRQWTELPLWRTHPGVWAVDSNRARQAGLTCRPLADTVHDTWRWMGSDDRLPSGDGESSRAADHGMNPSRETELLRKWVDLGVR